MTTALFPIPQKRTARWVMTLADLALLLLGFLVMVHATEKRGTSRQVARAMRAALGDSGTSAIQVGIGGTEQPPALDANALAGFSAGSAALPAAVYPIAQWLRQAAADPRSRVLVTGHSDDREADRSTGGLVLASSRADTVARALIKTGAITADRVDLAASAGGRSRRVEITISFGPQ